MHLCRLVGDRGVSYQELILLLLELIFTVCLGLHLARMELRLATALLFRALPNARISAKEGMSTRDMEMEAFFLMAPRGHRCLIEAE